MNYKKPNLFYYRLAQFVSWFVARICFQRKVLRNEIRDAKGPFVVLANHQAAYDFVNLIGLCKRPMHFVVSNSFYSSLPVKGIMTKIGVIPKQQFQTAPVDIKRMKRVIEADQPLVIYPAGLMCEDGKSTTIPKGTYKFIKWLNADVYIAKVSGTYMAMPKWGSGIRKGKTTIDVYKLFSKEELAELEVETVKERAEEALWFDAYREQEELKGVYGKKVNIQNLEHVLYMCPHCKAEFSMKVLLESELLCKSCGSVHTSDIYGFLHHTAGPGPEFRYVSDWSQWIFEEVRRQVQQGENHLSATTKISMIHPKKNKFVEVGQGTVSLNEKQFLIEGVINGEPVSIPIPIGGVPMIPFIPGKYIELHKGMEIYRCQLEDGKLAMKFVNMLKAFYDIKNSSEEEKQQVS